MTAKNVKNVSPGPLGFPRGPTIMPGDTARIEGWEKIENNDVVKAWTTAKAIEVSDAPDRKPSEGEGDKSPEAQSTTGAGSRPPQGAGSNDGDKGIDDTGKTSLDDMTNAELARFIEKRGGDVKSNSTKEVLLAQARALPLEAPAA